MLASIVILLILAVSFAVTSLVVYGVCSAFDLNFTWKLAAAIWGIIFLIKTVIK